MFPAARREQYFDIGDTPVLAALVALGGYANSVSDWRGCFADQRAIMSAGRCLAEIRYEPGQVNEVLEFLKRTRSELRMLRKAYVYRDKVQIFDFNGDWFEVGV